HQHGIAFSSETPRHILVRSTNPAYVGQVYDAGNGFALGPEQETLGDAVFGANLDRFVGDIGTHACSLRGASDPGAGSSCAAGGFAGSNSDATNAINSMPPTTPREMCTGISIQCSAIIFAPIKVSTKASPTVRKRSLPRTPASRKYIERRPR